jgi:hypothetical protein
MPNAKRGSVLREGLLANQETHQIVPSNISLYGLKHLKFQSANKG